MSASDVDLAQEVMVGKSITRKVLHCSVIIFLFVIVDGVSFLLDYMVLASSLWDSWGLLFFLDQTSDHV